jgi:hypothetical protein
MDNIQVLDEGGDVWPVFDDIQQGENALGRGRVAYGEGAGAVEVKLCDIEERGGDKSGGVEGGSVANLFKNEMDNVFGDAEGLQTRWHRHRPSSAFPFSAALEHCLCLLTKQ